MATDGYRRYNTLSMQNPEPGSNLDYPSADPAGPWIAKGPKYSQDAKRGRLLLISGWAALALGGMPGLLFLWGTDPFRFIATAIAVVLGIALLSPVALGLFLLSMRALRRAELAALSTAQRSRAIQLRSWAIASAILVGLLILLALSCIAQRISFALKGY